MKKPLPYMGRHAVNVVIAASTNVGSSAFNYGQVQTLLDLFEASWPEHAQTCAQMMEDAQLADRLRPLGNGMSQQVERIVAQLRGRPIGVWSEPTEAEALEIMRHV